MADYYCDHGAYHYSATATASQSGSTLTVTGVTGKISIGSLIIGGGFTDAAQTRVTAFGANTFGGAGTYTVSTSATVASTAVVATEGLPAPVTLGTSGLIPNWGVPEDGDGTAKTASTAAATASIVFTGAPTAGTIVVLGQTLTVTWGATATTAADALAAAINASTLTAISPAGITSKSQIRNHLFARGPSNGAPANTCEVMMRQGTAAVNGQVVITHTLNNVSSAGTINFAGGVGGCWGHLFNHFPIWPSAITYTNHGLWASLPFVGTATANDVIHVRSGKTLRVGHTNLNNITYTFFGGSGFAGSAAAPLIYRVDDGTQWPADGSAPVLSIICLNSFSGALSLGTSGYTAAQNIAVIAPVYGASGVTKGLKFTPPSPSANSTFVRLGQVIQLVNVEIDASSATAPVTQFLEGPSFGGGYVRFQSCAFKSRSWLWTASSAQGAQEFIDCTFDSTGATVPSTGWIGTLNGHNGPVELTFDSCRFTGFVSGSRLFANGAVFSPQQQLQFLNCDFGNLGGRGPIARGIGSGRTLSFISSGMNQFGKGDFFIDYQPGYVDWQAGQGYPTLNATLLDGTTKWSMRVIPTVSAAGVGFSFPLVTPRFSKRNTLGEAVRTAKVELAIHTAHTWTKRDVSLQITYQEAGTNNIRVIDSHDPINRGALDVSASIWSSEQSGQVSFGSALFNKRSITLTTPTAVKAGTDVIAVVKFYQPVGDVGQGAFVDPDVVLS